VLEQGIQHGLKERVKRRIKRSDRVRFAEKV
jgi:hypothetical protein